MLTCHLEFPLFCGKLAAFSAASVFESWPEVVDVISKPVSIAMFAAGFFGLLIGWLLRGRGVSEPGGGVVEPTTGLPELWWRHEKLVLVERQERERQRRFRAFVENLPRLATETEMRFATRFFYFAERVRDARQKVGADHSRMVTVRDRLDAISGETGAGKEEIATARRIAESQIRFLGEARELLRPIGEKVMRLEESLSAGGRAETDRALRKELMALKGDLLLLPQGWSESGEESDERIREVIAGLEGEAFSAIHDILLLDGAVSPSLPESGGIYLVGAVSGVMEALEKSRACDGPAKPLVLNGDPETVRNELYAAQPPSSENDDDLLAMISGETFSGGNDPAPDSEFRNPEEFDHPPVRIGKGFHDLTNPGFTAGTEDLETSKQGDEEDENRSLILFCSNDVELWGKNIYRGAFCRARAIKDFPKWASWISIKRLDTGERVFAPVRTASLFNGQTSDPVGFNGTNELFYGARHLGIFSESCPNEVETRFTYGGWGFGHRALEIAPEVEQLQAAGWEGKEIPSDTVFEIVIHEELPKLGATDRILDAHLKAGK